MSGGFISFKNDVSITWFLTPDICEHISEKLSGKCHCNLHNAMPAFYCCSPHTTMLLNASVWHGCPIPMLLVGYPYIGLTLLHGCIQSSDRNPISPGLGDGSKWVWNIANNHFPEAVQIVGWYHAEERLWKVAPAVYGEGSSTMKKWTVRIPRWNKILAQLSIHFGEKMEKYLWRRQCWSLHKTLDRPIMSIIALDMNWHQGQIALDL